MSNFERNTWCLLGIPIDVISYEQSVKQISTAALQRQPCFFSTPNLNFIIAAMKDDEFRRSVISSDLVLLDGMPPVWLAKMLGIPRIEKISGSNLFETLWQAKPKDGRKLRVFLFGGEDCIAAKACDRINRLATGIECVGYHNPGFSAVAAMSTGQLRDRVNQVEADFIVVALGAKKGQAWILENRSNLDAPVISHLGAVVNFAANSIERAPSWMQTIGVEWIWRIWQEPNLWKRYASDGVQLIGLMFSKVIPHILWRWYNFRRLENQQPVIFSIEENAGATTIFLRGDCLHQTIRVLKKVFAQEAKKGQAITLDLTAVKLLDSAFLGLCLLLQKEASQNGFQVSFTGVSRAQRRFFRMNCVDYLL